MTNKINSLFKLENENGTAWITCYRSNADEFERSLRELQTVTVSRFESGKMLLTDLPEEIQQQVRNTLRAFNECSVVYANRTFRSSTGCCIMADYPDDHFVCGYYKAKEVYTEAERRQNYIEEFGYTPARI